jgi:hypothetical protein
MTLTPIRKPEACPVVCVNSSSLSTRLVACTNTILVRLPPTPLSSSCPTPRGSARSSGGSGSGGNPRLHKGSRLPPSGNDASGLAAAAAATPRPPAYNKHSPHHWPTHRRRAAAAAAVAAAATLGFTRVRASHQAAMTPAACIDVIPCALPTHKVPLASAWHICERSECWIVGDPEELMEESNIIRRCDELSCARISIA